MPHVQGAACSFALSCVEACSNAAARTNKLKPAPAPATTTALQLVEEEGEGKTAPAITAPLPETRAALPTSLPSPRLATACNLTSPNTSTSLPGATIPTALIAAVPSPTTSSSTDASPAGSATACSSPTTTHCSQLSKPGWLSDSSGLSAHATSLRTFPEAAAATAAAAQPVEAAQKLKASVPEGACGTVPSEAVQAELAPAAVERAQAQAEGLVNQPLSSAQLQQALAAGTGGAPMHMATPAAGAYPWLTSGALAAWEERMSSAPLVAEFREEFSASVKDGQWNQPQRLQWLTLGTGGQASVFCPNVKHPHYAVKVLHSEKDYAQELAAYAVTSLGADAGGCGGATLTPQLLGCTTLGSGGHALLLEYMPGDTLDTAVRVSGSRALGHPAQRVHLGLHGVCGTCTCCAAVRMHACMGAQVLRLPAHSDTASLRLRPSVFPSSITRPPTLHAPARCLAMHRRTR